MDWRSAFEEVYSQPASRVTAEIWRAVFGDEYPEGLDHYSYVSSSELDRYVAELTTLGPGPTHLLDVGCGRGGPGLWVALRAGARLTGVDIAEEAVAESRRRAERMGLADRASYHRGTFQELPLADGEIDAVMSIDAFLFAPDKRAAACELARVLRPGGVLMMTTWDYHQQPENRPPQVGDHRPLLTDAGFVVQEYAETDDWHRRLDETSRQTLERVDELAVELGEPVEDQRLGLEQMRATLACMTRRVLVVADRT